MKLFNIPWATANRGILTKLYILFVHVEIKCNFFSFFSSLYMWMHVCFLPAERSGLLQTVTEVLKMLPKATGRGQYL